MIEDIIKYINPLDLIHYGINLYGLSMQEIVDEYYFEGIHYHHNDMGLWIEDREHDTIIQMWISDFYQIYFPDFRNKSILTQKYSNKLLKKWLKENINLKKQIEVHNKISNILNNDFYY